MVLKRFKLLILLAYSLQIIGCASIVSSSNKTLPISTQPDEATCEIIDLSSGTVITRTKTPHNAILDASSGFFKSAEYKIKLSKAGYIPYETQVISNINGWYFGNIVFGGLLGVLIVDPATGAMWKIYEDKINVKLYPDTMEGRRLYSDSLNMQGYELVQQANYIKAISFFDKAIEINPEFVKPYSNKGLCYSKLSENSKAMEYLNKAISINADFPNAYKHRGDIYFKQGETNKALDDFNKAILLHPKYNDALLSRGKLYLAQNNKEQAKVDITLACKQGYSKACNFQF